MGFANIYSEAAEAILARREGRDPAPEVMFPGISDGVEGMAFIDACVRSSKLGARWTALRMQL